MSTVVVVGNPKPNSRTLAAGVRLGRRLAKGPVAAVVDVIGLGPGVLGFGDAAVREAMDTVAGADLAIVASPTFKGAYSGVLKAFLDQFATGNGLRGVTAVPLMLGAGLAHAMAPDLLLRPVLSEIGATVPTPGLFMLEDDATWDDTLDLWLARWQPSLTLAAEIPRANPQGHGPERDWR